MPADRPETLTIFTDGASLGNPGPAGLGVVLQDPNGETLEEISEPLGVATNNAAEYQAVIRGLARALALGRRDVRLVTDSELVARQISGQYKVRSEALKPLVALLRDLIAALDRFDVEHTLREGNRRADKLAGDAAKKAASGHRSG